MASPDDLRTTRTRLSSVEATQLGLRVSVEALHVTVRGMAAEHQTGRAEVIDEVRGLRQDLREDMASTRALIESHRSEFLSHRTEAQQHGAQLASLQRWRAMREARARLGWQYALSALGAVALALLVWALSAVSFPWR